MSSRGRTVVSLCLMFVLVLAVQAFAADAPYWPGFHGPNGDNRSTDTGLLAAWPEGGPKLLWTAEGLGDGFASVAIANGLLYTAGQGEEKTFITAMNLDGEVQWKVENGPAWTENFPGSRGTPTIDGDRLYHENPHGDVICLDAKTGDVIWQRNIVKEFGSTNIRWALAESVLIDGDRAICGPFGEKVSLVALDKMTGKTVWIADSIGGTYADKAEDAEEGATAYSADNAAYCTATLVEYAGLRMLLTMNQRALVGVDADNGNVLFRHEHLTKYDVNVLTPIFRDGKVFISSGYGAGSQMVQLTVDNGLITAEQVWESTEMDNHHGGVVLIDGYLYGASAKGVWVCYDWDSGEVKYAEKGVGKGSSTVAEGMLYILNETNTVGLVPITPDAHQVVSQFDIPEGGEGRSWAHPVVTAGRLYIRHGDFLYVYDVEAK